MAVYPSQYKVFPTHRNQIEDVDANDINAIQDEVNAIQKILGRNPQRFVNTEASVTDFYPSIVGGSSAGGLETDITGSLVNYGLIDRTIRADTREYATLADRLNDIQRGKSWHCFKLRATSVDIPPSGTGIDARPRGIYFPRPSSTNDPFSMHNGVGVTIKKSGFWVFDGHVVYNLQAAVAANNNGIYNLAVDVDFEYLDGLSRQEHTQNNWAVIIQTTRMGYFDRGQRVTLRTSHNSTPTQKVRLATLSGHIIRESD